MKLSPDRLEELKWEMLGMWHRREAHRTGWGLNKGQRAMRRFIKSSPVKNKMSVSIAEVFR